MSEKFDFILFGATGFTGGYVLEELLRMQKSAQFTFAVAGRSISKLQNVINESYEFTKIEPRKEIERIVCDIEDSASIISMTSRAKVILNCVGPYRFYGRAVIEACLETGTHHLDISGEPQFLETVQLECHQRARDKGIYIIGACGFDSLPVEAGIIKLTNECEDCDINEIDCVMQFHSEHGTRINAGTWLSMIHGVAHWKELAEIRAGLYPNRLPRPQFKQATRPVVSYDSRSQGYVVPFLGSDKSVVYRSQRYLSESLPARMIQFSPYFLAGSLPRALGMLLFGAVFFLLTSFKWTRQLLEKYPRLFSANLFAYEGPSRVQVAGNSFSLVLTARGWKAPFSVDCARDSAPGLLAECEVSGPDPGYVACAVCLVQCGLLLIEETDRLPAGGGVYSPGAAFAKTSLVDRMSLNNILIKAKMCE